MSQGYGPSARAVIESAVTIVVLGLVAGCGGTADEQAEIELREVDGATSDESSRRNEPGDGFVPSAGPAELLVDVDGLTFGEAELPSPIELELLRVDRESAPATFTVARGDDPVGRLTIVPTVTSDGDVVDRFFAEPIEFLADEPITTDDGSVIVATNAVRPRWVALGDEFVMHAHEEVDDLARWQWFHGDDLWILEGSSASEAVVTSIIEAQHALAPPDAFDTHLIAGELNERFLDAPAYWYWDQPRAALLEALDESALVPCSSQYLGFLVSEGPAEPSGTEGIAVEVAMFGNDCDGAAEEFMDFYRATAGSTVEDISGVEVVTAGADMGWVEDGIAFHIHLFETANRERFRPFIDEYIAYQAALPAPS